VASSHTLVSVIEGRSDAALAHLSDHSPCSETP